MGLSLRLWLGYRRFLETPGGSSGLNKILGLALYVACLMFASLLLFLMFLGQTRTFIRSYTSESSTSRNAVPHQFPDWVMCPSKRVLTPPNSFNVWYAENTIKEMGIKSDEVEGITRLYYDRCSADLSENCEAMRTPCPGEMKSTCHRVEQSLRALMKNTNGYHTEYLEEKTKINLAFTALEKYGMTPLVLWLLVIKPRYPTFWKYSKSLNVTVYPLQTFHFYKDGKRDLGLIDICYDEWYNIWVDKTLCYIIRGSKLPLTETPYFGITGAVSGRFWFGNLETMKVSDRSFTTTKLPLSFQKEVGFVPQERASSIAYYAMTRIEEPYKVLDCTEQPSVIGITDTCQAKKAHWYYDLSFNTDRFLTSIWIYPTSVTQIYKERSYTLYTQVEIAAGLFGTCIGISLFQTIELCFGAIQARFCQIPNRHKIGKALKWTLNILLTISAVIVTGYDASSYFKSSVSKEFKIQSQEYYTVPLIRICSERQHPYSFWNTTKFHEFNVSLETAAFIRSFAWSKKYAGMTSLSYTPTLDGLLVPNYQISSLDLEHIRAKNVTIVEKGNWTEFGPCLHQEGVVLSSVTTIKSNSSQVTCLYLLFRLASPMFEYVFVRDNIYNWFAEFNKPFEKSFDLNETNEIEQNLFLFLGENLNKSRYREFTNRILKETSDIPQKIGEGKKNPYLVDISNAFLPDPEAFLKCYKNEMEIENCGSHFAVYLENLGHHDESGGKAGFCLVMESKETFRPIQSLGLSNGLELVFDSQEFRLNSDAVEYYGPGTFQNTLKHLPVGACLEGTQYCARDFTSFELKLTHPAGGFTSETLRLGKMGLFGHNSMAVNLKSSFNKLLDWNNDCVAKKDIVCKHPAEELNEVYMAVQMQIYCRCGYCPHRRDKFILHMNYIMGDSFRCCTVQNMLDCYFRHAKDVRIKSDGSYDLNSPRREVLAFFLKRYPGSVASWRAIINTTMLDAIFKWPNDDTSLLNEDVKKRIIKLCARCVKPHCEELSVKVASVQNIPSQDFGKKDRILLFYGRSDSEGVEEVYRLDPALLLGAISCACSFTFGIGLVGALEVFVTIIVKIHSKDKNSSNNILHRHVVRSFTVWQNLSLSIHPEKGIQSSTQLHGLESSEDRRIQVAPTAENQKGTGPAEEVMSDFEKADTGVKNDDRMEQVQDETLRRTAAVMWFFLLLGTGVVLAFTGWFMSRSFFLTQTTVDIQSQPVINLPSVAICTRQRPEDLHQFIRLSQCSVQRTKMSDCSLKFNKFFRRTASQTCLLLDNSQKFATLDLLNEDLRMEAPTNSSAYTIWIGGLNDTTIREIAPSLSWLNNDLTLTYTVELKRRQLSDCRQKIQDEDVSICPIGNLKNMLPEDVCSLTPDELAPRVISDGSCLQHIYDVAISKNAKTQSKTKTLKLSASKEIMTVITERSKFSVIDGFSIIGGVMGSMLEITVLNLVALLPISIGYLKRQFW